MHRNRALSPVRGLTILLAGVGVACACGCTRPALNRADGDLDRALGAAAHARPAAGDKPVPGEVLTYDLEPFAQAGLASPESTVPNMILRFCAPAKFEDPYHLRVYGRHLVVRHEPAVLARVRALLQYLEQEKLAPIALDVHLVEVPADLAAPLDGPRGIDARLPDELRTGLVDALARGKARTLARRQLRLVNGRWGRVADERARRPVVAVAVENGRPIEVQDTVSDGIALNAGVWLSAAGDAVVHLEAALQVESAQDAPRKAAAAFHPDPKDLSREVKAAIDLPTLRTTAIRGQMRVERGAWHVAGAAPSPAGGGVTLALVRADWSPAPALALPDGAGKRAATALRIALPEARGGGASAGQSGASQPGPAQGYVWAVKKGEAQSDAREWLGHEVNRQVAFRTTVVNDIEVNQTGATPALSLGAPSGQGSVGGWVRFGGADAGGSRRPMGGLAAPFWQPLLPDDLEGRRRRVHEATWDDTTAAFFDWDALFVVNDPKTVEATEALFRDVQAWRNRPLRVRAEWVELPVAGLEALSAPGALARELETIRKHRVLPAFEVVARSGAWTEMAVSKNHSVLWGFMGPDRGSPEVRTLDEGGKLSVLPRRYGNGRVEIDVRFAYNELDRASLEPVEDAGGLLQKPRFTQSTVEQVLAIESGKPVLLVESGNGGATVRALLVTAWH